MTSAFNPIIGKEKISILKLLLLRPRPEPGVAFVLVRQGHAAVALWSDDQLKAHHIWSGDYQMLYRIDVSEHTLDIDCSLPCNSEGFNFRAEAHIAYWVDDPVAIVNRKISNAEAVLKPVLIQFMRSFSRQFDLKDSMGAERKIIQAVEQQPKHGGFELTSFVVNISMEQDECDHVRRMRGLERSEEYMLRIGDYREKLDVRAGELAQQNIDFYNKLISSGYGQLAILHLAQHPDDVQSVMGLLSQQLQQDRDYWLQAFSALRDADAVEPFQLKEAREYVLRRFAESDKKVMATEVIAGRNDLQSSVNQSSSMPESQTSTSPNSASGDQVVVSSDQDQPPLQARAVGDPNNPPPQP